MGDMNAVSNLGYCYLYGRDIEQNTSLAIAYFKTAAENGVIDAMYKLGDIYSSDKWNVKDVELSLYYYNMRYFICSEKTSGMLNQSYIVKDSRDTPAFAMHWAERCQGEAE